MAPAKAKAKAPKEELPAEDTAKESAERESLVRELTIQNLQAKLLRTEAESARVGAENKQLKEDLRHAQEALRDVSGHLKRELGAKVD